MVRISKAATRVYLMYSHSHSSSVSSTSWSTAYFPSSLRSQSSNVTAFFFPATPAVTIEDCCSWQVVAISVSRVIRTPSLISTLGTPTSQREAPPKPSNNTDQQAQDASTETASVDLQFVVFPKNEFNGKVLPRRTLYNEVVRNSAAAKERLDARRSFNQCQANERTTS